MTSEEMEQLMMNKLINGLVKKAVKRIKDMKPWERENNVPRQTLKSSEAAKYLGISESLLNKLDIPCLRPTGEGKGRKKLYRIKRLEEWMEKQEAESMKTAEDYLDDQMTEDEMKVV